MATYTGPKVRLSRQLGVAISDNPKHLNSRRLDTPPGGAGKRMRRLSDYGVRLREKQKLRYYYNVQERQLRRYVKESIRRKGNTGENLLEILERRLDNVVRRMNFGRSIWHARQIVNHGHLLVNGRKVDIPSYRVQPQDIIEVRPGSREMTPFVVAHAEIGEKDVPAWLEVVPSKMRILVHSLPARQVIDTPVQEQLIVELYSK